MSLPGSGSSPSSPFPSVSFSQFVSHCSQQCSVVDSSFDSFEVEFEVLNQLEESSVHSAAASKLFDPACQPANQRKNRYNNVLPYCESRVKLVERHAGESDYINASFIDSSLVHPAEFDRFDYVASQAPPPAAFSDFYQMLVEQRIALVLMLTKEREKDRHEMVYVKADAYWPEAGKSALHRAWKVENTAEEKLSEDLTIRCLRISRAQPPVDHTVYQFHYTGWPDHGVPTQANFQSFIALFQAYRDKRNIVHQQWLAERQNQMQSPADGQTVARPPPILVHCSAGIGKVTPSIPSRLPRHHH
jgi:tyrosine-protein phosphatase non-receptor type 11